jgi:hypothetical protein
MKKNRFAILIALMLPVSISLLLFINYINSTNGHNRIQSESGYYLFLAAVVIASLIFSILQEGVISRKHFFKQALKMSIIMIVIVSLDLALHVLARGLIYSPDASAITNAGFTHYLTLLQSAWKIYGVRFILVVLIGNIIYFCVSSVKQKQRKPKIIYD